jgi:hypothetical protein
MMVTAGHGWSLTSSGNGWPRLDMVFLGWSAQKCRGGATRRHFGVSSDGVSSDGVDETMEHGAETRLTWWWERLKWPEWPVYFPATYP